MSRPFRPSYVSARYYDRPDLVRHDYRHTYTYYDPHYRLHHRVIWPSYHYPVCYRFGHHTMFRHVYPYYHRKYVFISLGGWWPLDYSYARYYWYGYHPYVWYGYYPIAREVASDNYNYYTYNYYYQNDDGEYTSAGSQMPAEAGAQPVDRSTWADVREKLDQQDAQPAAATLADTRFEEGVKSFEAGNYDVAARQFEEALRLSPGDVILPFAYAQALFANGRYTESATLLRKALSTASPEKEGVFYPRGLYANDDVLFAQIEDLVENLDRFGYDGDMQLLLGYHLLGVGETGYAREPLEIAGQDLQNAESARVLLKVLDKIEKEAAAQKTDGAAAESPGDTVGDVVAAKTAVAAEPNAVTTPAAEQPSSLPDVPPEVPAQEEPISDRSQDGTAGTQADVKGMTVPKPSGGDDGSGGATPPVVPSNNTGTSSKPPESSDGAGGVFANLPSDMIAEIGRYARVDFGIFAGIVLLAGAGVYLQWRLLDSDRV